MASVYKDKARNKWRARYDGPDGRRRGKDFHRKAVAEKWLANQLADMERGDWIDPQGGRITFADWSASWLAGLPIKAQTRESYRQAIVDANAAFGARPLTALRRSMIVTWVGDMSQRLGPSTTTARYRIVAMCLKAAVSDRLLRQSPCENVPLPRSTKGKVIPPTDEEVLAVVETISPRFRAAVLLMAGTGARQGEAMGLTVDRAGLVPSLDPVLTIDRQLLTPSSRGQRPYLGPVKRESSVRRVPLPEAVRDGLAAHLAEFGPLTVQIDVADDAGRRKTETVELVFGSRTGGPVTRSSIGDSVRRAAERAGAKGITPHMLRHYYASTLIAAGEDVVTVQNRLGHKNASETLDTYSHLFPNKGGDRTRRAIDRALGQALTRQDSPGEDLTADGAA